jgi:SNF2 family DNA or RNA helicase
MSPLITLGNWKKEFANFSKLKPHDIVVLGEGRRRASGKQKVKDFTDAVTDASGALTKNKIIVMNYECLQNEVLMEAITNWAPEILICDEAHRLRNHEGKRARRACKLADRIENKYMLTGTPILNDALDIFHLYRIMDGGHTFGNNFYAFRGRYFEDLNSGWAGKQGYFPDFSERPELFPDLQKKMYFRDGQPHAHRVQTKDCVDLPPLLKTTIEVELGTDQAKLYREMRDEFLTYVDRLKSEGNPIAVVAQLAVTKALRLQQIASGFVKAEDGREYPIVDNPRLEALEDFLEDAAAGKGQKIIVWSCFKNNYQDIQRVCEKLKLPYRKLTGEQSIGEKEASMHEFRTDPLVKVMIANQSAGGIGVNLVEAPIAVFYSRNFSLEADLQAEARNYRGGSNIHDKVLRVDFIAKNTIDEIVAEALGRKQSISDQILTLAETRQI